MVWTLLNKLRPQNPVHNCQHHLLRQIGPHTSMHPQWAPRNHNWEHGGAQEEDLPALLPGGLEPKGGKGTRQL